MSAALQLMGILAGAAIGHELFMVWHRRTR